MINSVTNGSVNFERVTQDELEKVRKLHDEHSKEIDHDNKTIVKEDTELNYHETLLNLDELLQRQYGDEINKKNAKLAQQLNDGKISLTRYNERRLTIDKYLNHTGKNAKKAFTLAVVYMGDSEQTKQKLDQLGFKYEVQQIKGEDGQMHNHFHLTDKKQRQQWKQLWSDAFRGYANAINKHEGIKIFDMTVHMDEASPHCHYKILNCGHSDTSKASYNLTQALSDFNVSWGKNRQYSKVTKKSPKKRLSGKSTLKTSREILDKVAVDALNWSVKQNGLNVKWHFQHKGDQAKLTNQMTSSEFKEYKASRQGLESAYKAVTGREAVDKDNYPLSPLDMLNEVNRSVTRSKNNAEQAVKQSNEQVTSNQQQINDLQQQQQRLRENIKALRATSDDIKRQNEDEKKQLNRRKLRRQQIEENAEKAKEYDQIKEYMDKRSAPNKPLFDRVKETFDTVKRQGRALVKASKLKQQLQRVVGNMFGAHFGQPGDSFVNKLDDPNMEKFDDYEKLSREAYKQARGVDSPYYRKKPSGTGGQQQAKHWTREKKKEEESYWGE